ncbi:ABC-2 type transport system permease protein [Micromonospora sediminicola]|uniref:ABC-2 type transport system permease protein n=1 Tax=Micromonospora sediminicola TaxID=946078 RepID=A0A1A9B3Q8_9ACTN|nr:MULTISPECIES: ABC transporter permease [Micromonospora]SBT63681.1 ABC-2 type transport system permease protein [Micromonospora sediminicola]
MTDPAAPPSVRPQRRAPARALMQTAEALRLAAAAGFADFAAIHTWRTWLFGWLGRVLCQVAFFALIGRLLDSADSTRYLLVGNAVLIAVMESMFVVASTTWERRTGVLPLLVAAPTDPVLVFCGRSAQWLASGTVSATIALFVMAPVFGVELPMPRALLVVPLIGLVSVSAYCFALVLAGLVLRAMMLRNVVGNIGWLCISLVAGAQVPVQALPDWLRAVGFVSPARHGTAAVRATLDHRPGSEVLRQAGLELLVAAGWLTVAVLTFRRLAEHGRRDGSITFDG